MLMLDSRWMRTFPLQNDSRGCISMRSLFDRGLSGHVSRGAGSLYPSPAPISSRSRCVRAAGSILGTAEAVGDPYQPGVFLALNPTTGLGSDQLDVQVTLLPALLMVSMYGNDGSFVWSNQRLFQLIASSDLGLAYSPGGSGSGAVPFVAQEVKGCPGLFAPWWFCVAS